MSKWAGGSLTIGEASFIPGGRLTLELDFPGGRFTLD